MRERPGQPTRKILPVGGVDACLKVAQTGVATSDRKSKVGGEET